MKPHQRAALFAVLFVMLAPFAAGPVSADEEPEGPARRELGGHRFLPSSLVSDPFVTTHISSRTGAGLAGDFKSPFFDVNGDSLGTLEGDIGFFGLEFEYQQNIYNWAALRLNLSGTGRVGVDGQSLLADGATTIYGAVFEGKARIVRRENWLVTGLVRLSRKNVFVISLKDFARSVIDNGGLTDDTRLIQEGNLLRLTAGVAGAYAPAEWVGLTGQVHVGTAEPFDRTKSDETAFLWAVTSSFDLRTTVGWPVGFLVSFDYDSFPEGGSDVVKGLYRTGLGVFYTGRQDFTIGLQLNTSTLKQSDVDESFQANSADLYLRYYF